MVYWIQLKLYQVCGIVLSKCQPSINDLLPGPCFHIPRNRKTLTPTVPAILPWTRSGLGVQRKSRASSVEGAEAEGWWEAVKDQ